MSETEIRWAVKSDVERIIPLWHDLMEFHLTEDVSFKMAADAEDKFRTFLEENIKNNQKETIVLVAVDKMNPNALVGYCMGGISERPPVFEVTKIGYIWDMLVTERTRQQHVGQALFKSAEKWFLEQGMSRVELNVGSKNPISPKFWRKMGFQPYMEVMYQDYL